MKILDLIKRKKKSAVPDELPSLPTPNVVQSTPEEPKPSVSQFEQFVKEKEAANHLSHPPQPTPEPVPPQNAPRAPVEEDDEPLDEFLAKQMSGHEEEPAQPAAPVDHDIHKPPKKETVEESEPVSQEQQRSPEETHPHTYMPPKKAKVAPAEVKKEEEKISTPSVHATKPTSDIAINPKNLYFSKLISNIHNKGLHQDVEDELRKIDSHAVLTQMHDTMNEELHEESVSAFEQKILDTMKPLEKYEAEWRHLKSEIDRKSILLKEKEGKIKELTNTLKKLLDDKPQRNE